MIMMLHQPIIQILFNPLHRLIERKLRVPPGMTLTIQILCVDMILTTVEELDDYPQEDANTPKN